MSVKALIASYKAEGQLDDRRLPSPLDDLDRNELAVARWLLWRYNDKNGECTPSDRDIAIGTGLSVRSAERARRALSDRGLLTWRERRASGKRGSNEYDLTAILTVCGVEQGDSSSGSPQEQTDNLAELTDKSVGANRQNGASQPDRLTEEQQHVELEEEKKEEAAAAAAHSSVDEDLDQLVTRIHTMWKSEVYPDEKKPLTDARRRVIAARLDHYEPEEIEQAIRNRDRSDWFSGRKPQDRKQRFDLTDLLASDETLEELREAKAARAADGFIDGLNAGRSSNKGMAQAARFNAEAERLEAEERRRKYAEYDAKVEEAYVAPTSTPAQIRAEHAELVDDLEALKDQYARNESPTTLKGVEQRRAEVAELEHEHPTVFGEVAA